MPTILTQSQIKDWAWDWANRLHKDISLTQQWYDEVKNISAVSLCNGSTDYEAALSLCSTAYFEFLKGRWSKEKAERQINESLKPLEGLQHG